jgi:ribonuclease P protein component
MLRQPRAFAACFSARYFQQAEFRLHYCTALESSTVQHGAAPQCWLGLVIPKKFCKPAVRRNLIKRVIRQALRDLQLPAEARLQAPVLMFRLTHKLPVHFRSARSAALLDHVRHAVDALLAMWLERTVVLPQRGLV